MVSFGAGNYELKTYLYGKVLRCWACSMPPAFAALVPIYVKGIDFFPLNIRRFFVITSFFLSIFGGLLGGRWWEGYLGIVPPVPQFMNGLPWDIFSSVTGALNSVLWAMVIAVILKNISNSK